MTSYQSSKLGKEQQQQQATTPTVRDALVYRSPPPIPTTNAELSSPGAPLPPPPQPPVRTNIKTSLNHKIAMQNHQNNHNHNDDVKSHNLNEHTNSATAHLLASNVYNQNSFVTNNHNVTPTTSANNNNNNHENATDAVARLVYKTVMMGSVPSLNMTSNNNNNNQLSLATVQNDVDPTTTTAQISFKNHQSVNNSLSLLISLKNIFVA
jgi:hypothetical protein